jgi:hypothetical protein
MKTASIELSKYKRFFAFGCSFTDYYWPTWADIVGHHFSGNYFNHGNSGCANGHILRTFVEMNQRYNFNKDDLIMIAWTDYLRDEGWRPDTGLQGCGSILHNFQYTKYNWNEHFSKLNVNEFLKRDLIYMRTAILLSEKFESNLFMFSINDISNAEMDEYGVTASPEILALFPEVVEKLLYSFQETVQWKDHKGIPAISGHDNHPSPGMHLTHLLKVFPNLKLNQNAVDFANDYEKLVRSRVHTGDAVFEKERVYYPGPSPRFIGS